MRSKRNQRWLPAIFFLFVLEIVQCTKKCPYRVCHIFFFVNGEATMHIFFVFAVANNEAKPRCRLHLYFLYLPQVWKHAFLKKELEAMGY
jgi:hypothetical protein